ncbi:hypothetical protein A3C96_00725 [Candidatus Uhrbacteria bacterium RIFCSPHIGHO2_02_FULL_60_10]|uniref:Uncharacterized protein n=1 Tax=Candidatus Uhrbacteria bacterium RIFCSPHIGHO2_02_FULL_60_10 TaxID=1802392 RepID=A0A1F7U6B3_9BACT|nr:MAG: hypothetical protein A3C96_00725 [Candidatus Uhrbacteria bacterium RIFCSPHIGHO2_02_FULL_60_10]
MSEEILHQSSPDPDDHPGERGRRKKVFIVAVGVTMTAIVAAWIFLLPYQLKDRGFSLLNSEEERAKAQESLQALQRQLEQLGTGAKEAVKEAAKDATIENVRNAYAKSTPEIEKLKARIAEEAAKNAAVDQP